MKRMMIILSVTMIVATTSILSQIKYELPGGTILNGVSRISGILPKSAKTITNIVLDSSTFKDVQRDFGYSKNLPRSADPHEADIICYYADQDTNVYLLFTAGSPENPTDKLTSFTLSKNSFLRIKQWQGNCSKKLTSRVAIANGLKLELTQSQVRAILGSPSKRTTDWMIYSFEYFQEFTQAEKEMFGIAPGGGYYKGKWIYNDLIAHFTKRKMDFLHVSVKGEMDW